MAAELLEREIVDLTAGTRVARRKLEREVEVREGLERLIGLAEAALGEDPKLDALVAQIAEIREAEPDANVLVYTEYADSQRAVGGRWTRRRSARSWRARCSSSAARIPTISGR